MSLGLYDHVRIRNKDVTGEIIDIYKNQNGSVYYVVESDIEGPTDDPDAYNIRWPQYDCTADQLEKI